MFLIRYLARCEACGMEEEVMTLVLTWPQSRAFVPSLPPGWSGGLEGKCYCPRHQVVLRCEVDGVSS